MRVSLLTSALLFSAAAVNAAELGTLSVTSSVNEPFKAQLQIRDVDLNAPAPSVRLAAAATYARIGKTAVPETQDLKLTLISKEPYRVRIEGEQPMRQQTFPLIIELAEGNKLSARLYSVKLVQPVVQPVSKGTSTQTSTAEVAARNHANTLQEKRLKAEVKPTPKKQVENHFDINKPYVITRGMNMWTLSKLYMPHYPDATIDQIAVGLLRANQKCFKNAQLAGMWPGCELTAPQQAEVMAIPLADAWAHVRVNPRADATKPASERDIAKALRAMKKTSPSLYKRAVEQIRSERDSATSATTSSDVKTTEHLQSQSDNKQSAPKHESEVAEPTVVQTAPEPIESAQTPQQSPAAGSSSDNTPPATEGATPAEPVSAGDLVNESAQQESSTGGLTALLLGLLAVVGGGYWWIRRRRKLAAEQACFEKKVRFTHPEPTTEDQIRGVDAMVKNRIEADAAAERGFPTPTTKQTLNLHTVEESTPTSRSESAAVKEPTPVMPDAFRVKPQTTTEERREPSFLADREDNTRMDQGVRFSVSSAYAGVGATPRDGELPLKVEPTMSSSIQPQATSKATAMRLIEPDEKMIRACAEKLEISRQYISIGAGPKCKPLLESVILQGSLDQKAMAIDLLKKLGGH